MKRLLTVAAIVSASGLALFATFRNAPNASDTVANTKTLIAHFAARDGFVPPPGKCHDVEATLSGDGDAGERTMTPVTLCNLGLGTWTLDVATGQWTGPDMDRKCRQSARAVCYDAPAEDAGDDTRTDLERRCFRAAVKECLSALPKAGGITWATPLRDATALDTVEVDRLSKRERMATFCACRNRVDAGACRIWSAGDDAGGREPAPYRTTLQPGTYSGAGCVATPCSESEAREADPEGTLLAKECR